MRHAAVLIVLSICWLSPAFAGQPYGEVYAKYPSKEYVVGIGEVERTGSALRDRRVAEVFARREIASQIRIKVMEESVDLMCEGGGASLFTDMDECRSEYVSVLETTVDEFLEGSRVVSHGERGGIYYAVAVMAWADAARTLGSRVDESIQKSRESLDRAKDGDGDSLQQAKEEYMKARTFSREKEILEGVKGRADGLFEDLEKEIAKLEGR